MWKRARTCVYTYSQNISVTQTCVFNPEAYGWSYTWFKPTDQCYWASQWNLFYLEESHITESQHKCTLTQKLVFPVNPVFSRASFDSIQLHWKPETAVRTKACFDDSTVGVLHRHTLSVCQSGESQKGCSGAGELENPLVMLLHYRFTEAVLLLCCSDTDAFKPERYRELMVLRGQLPPDPSYYQLVVLIQMSLLLIVY